MGGGSGYGPTHSQSLERLFIGCDGLDVFSVNTMTDLNNLYKTAISAGNPKAISAGDVLITYAGIDLRNDKFGFKPTTSIEDGLSKFVD